MTSRPCYLAHDLQSTTSGERADNLCDTGTKSEAQTCSKNPTPGNLLITNEANAPEEAHCMNGLTLAGPPVSKGVLNVVEILEQRPYFIISPALFGE
jgi:hypothetical protein